MGLQISWEYGTRISGIIAALTDSAAANDAGLQIGRADDSSDQLMTRWSLSTLNVKG